MAKTMFKRLAGRFNTSHPTSPKDHEVYLSDNGTTLSYMIYDTTNSKWVGIALTTSTSTSTTTTSTSTSTS